MKPAGILLPDRAHRPGGLTVELADLEFLRQHDFAHQRMHVLARVHAGDHGVANERDRCVHLVEAGADFFRAADGFSVAGDQQFSAKIAHALQRTQITLRQTRLVAAHRGEVRHRQEHWPEQIAGEGDLVLRQPHHERAQSLPARRRDQLKALAANLERAVPIHGHVGRDFRRRNWIGAALDRAAPQFARALGEIGPKFVEKIPGIAKAPLGHDFRARLDQRWHAAIMIGVRLSENDLAQRAAAPRRQQRLVALGIVHEAGVDQHVTIGGVHQIGVGDVLHHEDEVVDRLGFGLAIAGEHQVRERGLFVCFRIAHAVASKSIMTFADAGVAAMLRPSMILSNGRRWLIRLSAFSRMRGNAATTSGISVG